MWSHLNGGVRAGMAKPVESHEDHLSRQQVFRDRGRIPSGTQCVLLPQPLWQQELAVLTLF